MISEIMTQKNIINSVLKDISQRDVIVLDSFTYTGWVSIMPSLKIKMLVIGNDELGNMQIFKTENRNVEIILPEEFHSLCNSFTLEMDKGNYQKMMDKYFSKNTVKVKPR